MSDRTRMIFALVPSLLLGSGLSGAASFTYSTLTLTGQRGVEAASTINAINNEDQVVGGVVDDSSNYQGFVWADGKFTLYPAATTLAVIDNDGNAAGYSQELTGYVEIDTRTGAVHTFNNGFDKDPFIGHIYGVAAGGTVVVQDEYGTDVTAGYIFKGAKKTRLLVAGSDLKYGGTFATAINDSQVVTGSYYAGGAYEHGFVYESGNFTSFDVPGAAGGTFPYFIGADGSTIAGGFSTAPSVPQLGFVRRGGSFTTISPAGATSSYVSAVGPGGELVGSYWDATGGHGFIYRNGTYYTIDVPGGTFTTIDAVNARGTLVGSYHDSNGVVVSYVAKCAHGLECTE